MAQNFGPIIFVRQIFEVIAGVDMKTVSARAGHSKASTTSDFYSHFLKNSDIHASEVINKIFE